MLESWLTRSALAISEPFAGSDVAQIKATATRTADGKHFLVAWQMRTGCRFCLAG